MRIGLVWRGVVGPVMVKWGVPKQHSPLHSEEVGTGALLGEFIVRVSQRALFQRQATTADTGVQLLFDAREQVDSAGEFFFPGAAHVLPIFYRGRLILREGAEGGFDFFERESQSLRHFDVGNDSEHATRESALIALISQALDEALRLVEVDGRNGNSASSRQLSDRKHVIFIVLHYLKVTAVFHANT